MAPPLLPADGVETVGPSDPAPSPGAAEPWPDTGAPERPAVGEVWRGVYRVEEELPEHAGQRWRATRLDNGEPAVLRAFGVTPESRRAEVWQALRALDGAALVPVRDEWVVGRVRIEAVAEPAGEPLSTWQPAGGRDLATVERLVRALAAALGAMHAQGLAHFGVQPQHIFVRAGADEPEFVLGGFEAVDRIGGTELLPVEVDPFYAPPEAAGLFRHAPGPGLCAWDWWSLGRVVQEFLLGQHVLGHMLQRDVTRETPELLARAEALLLERDTGGVRAGAVEAMPSLPPRLESLLSGLLTAARDARWGADETARWLAGETVPQHYKLPRNERLFRWRNRAYPVPEAARALQHAEPWSEAIEQVWNHEKPGTLVHFLGDSTAHRPLRERHDEILKLSTATALRQIAPDLVRDLLASLALLQLAGSNLVWRGRSFGTDGVEKTLGSEAGAAAFVALAQAFTARPILLVVARYDAGASGALTEFGETIAAAESLARQHRWLSDRDAARRERLYRCALRPAAELRAVVQEMHTRFARSTNEAMNKLFKLASPGHAELALLAWAGEAAAACGFLTHQQWAERELARLRTAGAVQAAALWWLHLERPLALGPWVFGRWRSAVPAWLFLTLPLAFLLPGWRWLAVVLIPIVLLAGARVSAVLWLRLRLRLALPEAKPWAWRDGPVRCRRELIALGVPHSHAAASEALAAINGEISRLPALDPAPARVRAPRRLAAIWAISLASWLVVAGSVAGGFWRAKVQRPSWKAFMLAWNPPETAEDIARREAELARKDAEKNKGPVKISWPFKPGDYAPALRIRESVEPTKAQLRYANELGRKLVAPYKPETISTLIFFRVPTEQGVGIVMFDGKHGQLASPRVHLLDYSPLPRSWVEIAEKPGIFLQE